MLTLRHAGRTDSQERPIWESSMNVSLIVVTAEGKQAEIAVKKPVVVVGRQTDCQIRIPSSEISRHHCEVSIGEGKVSVRDLGSSNGTFVNKRRVTQAEVAAGDLIAIGDLVLVVRIDGRPAAIDSEDVLEDGQVRPVKASAPAAAAAAPTRSVTPKPAPKKRLTDSNDSSVGDFDFLDEDEDIKNQPKL